MAKIAFFNKKSIFVEVGPPCMLRLDHSGRGCGCGHMAMAMSKAAAAAAATAAATVIRPEHAEGARNHENRLLIEKRDFMLILAILGPSTSKIDPA